MKTVIDIVRHGATKLNNSSDLSDDRIRGWKDVPLNDEGRADASKAAMRLAPRRIKRIYTSDLVRAAETAQIIGKFLNVKPVDVHALRPWNLGHMTGTVTAKALPQIANYVRNKPDTPVPDGESFNDFKTRAFDGIRDILADTGSKLALLVTHHRVERLLAAWEAAGQPEDRSIDLDTFLQRGDPPGSVRTMKIDPEKLKAAALGAPARAGSDDRAGGGEVQSSAPPTSTRMLTHKEVDYGIGRPGGTCADCEYFAGRDRCLKRVAPPIMSAGWCKLFEARAAEADDDEAEEPKPNGRGKSPENLERLVHARAIGGAKALHVAGHITAEERDRHVEKARKAMKAPMGLR